MLTIPVALPALSSPAMTLQGYARLARLTMAEVLEECANGRLARATVGGRRLIVGVLG